MAGPVQRQARACVDHIFGIPSTNKGGVVGSSAVQVFDFNAASTGLNEKESHFLPDIISINIICLKKAYQIKFGKLFYIILFKLKILRQFFTTFWAKFKFTTYFFATIWAEVYFFSVRNIHVII